MSEKKPIKISLGNAICIVIIVVLIAVIIGMYVYYNKNNNLNNNNIKSNILKNNSIEVNKLNNSSVESNEKVKSNEVTEEKNEEIIIDKQNYFNEGTYLLSLSEKGEGKANRFLGFIANQINIKLYNGEFTSYLNEQFTINGQYESLENGKIKCYINKYSFTGNENTRTISLKENNWTIDFLIKNETELEVEAVNIGESSSELAIILCNAFDIRNKFTIYDENDFTGMWKSNTGLLYDDIGMRWEEQDLRSILGTSYIQVGSTFTFNSDNTFKDYVFPVTEGDRYREGTYVFDGLNKINLKYSDDPSYDVEIYIMNKDTIVYKNENSMFFMSR